MPVAEPAQTAPVAGTERNLQSNSNVLYNSCRWEGSLRGGSKALGLHYRVVLLLYCSLFLLLLVRHKRKHLFAWYTLLVVTWSRSIYINNSKTPALAYSLLLVEGSCCRCKKTRTPGDRSVARSATENLPRLLHRCIHSGCLRCLSRTTALLSVLLLLSRATITGSQVAQLLPSNRLDSTAVQVHTSQK